MLFPKTSLNRKFTVLCSGLICSFYVLIEGKYVVHTPTKLLLLSLSFKTVGSRWFEAECMTNKKIYPASVYMWSAHLYVHTFVLGLFVRNVCLPFKTILRLSISEHFKPLFFQRTLLLCALWFLVKKGRTINQNREDFKVFFLLFTFAEVFI